MIDQLMEEVCVEASKGLVVRIDSGASMQHAGIYMRSPEWVVCLSSLR